MHSLSVLVLTWALVAGCSGGAPGTGAGSAGPDTIRLALESGADTEVAVNVPPLSQCTVAEASGQQPMMAREDGVLRLHIKPTQAGTATVTLQCQDPQGQQTSHLLELTGTSDPDAIRVTKDAMASVLQPMGTTLRPALTGDPMSYSQDDLIKQGYGSRPDPTKKPQRYSNWLRGVTMPMKLVPSRAITGNVTFGPNENQAWGGLWSGAIMGNPAAGFSVSSAWFTDSLAEWNVPQAFAEATFANQSVAGSWVGLGGFPGGQLWQAGTAEFTTSAFWFQFSSYNAWTEFVPYQPTAQVLSNFNVNNGDDVAVDVFFCNSSTGAEELFGDTECAHVQNFTQGEDSLTLASAQGISVFFMPQTAEIIQERPLTGGSQIDYAQFNPFLFINGDVCSVGTGSSFFETCNGPGAVGSFLFGGSPYTTTMAEIGSPSHQIGGSCMADWNGNCTDDGVNVLVWWNAHN
jgi:hypothetical protein